MGVLFISVPLTSSVLHESGIRMDIAYVPGQYGQWAQATWGTGLFCIKCTTGFVWPGVPPVLWASRTVALCCAYRRTSGRFCLLVN